MRVEGLSEISVEVFAFLTHLSTLLSHHSVVILPIRILTFFIYFPEFVYIISYINRGTYAQNSKDTSLFNS